MKAPSIFNRHGNWLVARDCCLTGYCAECHWHARLGRPARIVHAQGYSEEYAKWVAKNWSSYKATAEQMTDEQEPA